MSDHRLYVALLAPLDEWSAGGGGLPRRLIGDDWGGGPVPVLEPTTGEPVGRVDRVAVTAAGLVGVGVLDLTGAYLAERDHVLEIALATAQSRQVDGGVEFWAGTIGHARLGVTPAWPGLWLRLDEGPCDTCGATPPNGGAKPYVDARGRQRLGCADDRGCSATYAQLSAAQRVDLDRARRAL